VCTGRGLLEWVILHITCITMCSFSHIFLVIPLVHLVSIHVLMESYLHYWLLLYSVGKPLDSAPPGTPSGTPGFYTVKTRSSTLPLTQRATVQPSAIRTRSASRAPSVMAKTSAASVDKSSARVSPLTPLSNESEKLANSSSLSQPTTIRT
jgi:hypothetical protein